MGAEAGATTPGRPPLAELIAHRRRGILLFGVTPPKITTDEERVAEIAAVTLARLTPLGLDGLIIYDIDDESERTSQERPFPYLPTVDPARFSTRYLSAWDRPVVVYRSVGKYSEEKLRRWLVEADAGRVLGVFVGASTRHRPGLTSLPAARILRRQVRPDLPLGAVTIAERHASRTDEHERMLIKQRDGCGFFVSQVVYDVDATRNLLSDYAYACVDAGLEPVPVIITLAVCGSSRTLEFLRWLGVVVPRWLENDLLRTPDPIAVSLEHCLRSAEELIRFGRRLGIPIGFNVESVSIRRVEIEAAVQLAAELRRMLDAHDEVAE